MSFIVSPLWSFIVISQLDVLLTSLLLNFNRNLSISILLLYTAKKIGLYPLLFYLLTSKKQSLSIWEVLLMLLTPLTDSLGSFSGDLSNDKLGSSPFKMISK
jgi:hypothetical protein